DENCYSCFEHNGKQYIKIMTLTKGRRMVLPLKGKTVISGNIRIVLQGETVYIHHSTSLKKSTVKNNDAPYVAIDFGYTEVLTDSEGHHYGEGFGQNMTAVSDWLKDKMVKRNQLYALQKKYGSSQNKAQQKKAKNILKNNLGKGKLKVKIDRHKATSLRLI